jgi:alcohol dehydrogenase (cytochrome c)
MHGDPHHRLTFAVARRRALPWAKGLDDSGRPMLLPGAEPSVEGTEVYPNVPGATNWFSPSYDPLADLFFVSVREEGGIYYKGEAKYKAGAFFNAGGARSIPVEAAWGAIRALAPDTGEVKWEFRLHSPPMAGVLSTAGGLVFGGTNEGGVFALDAATGKSLWKFQTGAFIQSNPISYLSDGKQHVAIAAGNAIFDFALE